jgi:hypothetical protein
MKTTLDGTFVPPLEPSSPPAVAGRSFGREYM